MSECGSRSHSDLETVGMGQSFFAHSHTHTQPPDGNNRQREDSQEKKVVKYRYTHCTTSAALQVAVDHAFTGTYVRLFRLNDSPEAQWSHLRSPQHITHSYY